MPLSSDSAPIRIAVVADAYYEEVIAGIAAYAQRHNWDLDTTMIRNPGTLPKQEDWAGVLATVNKDRTARWLGETHCPVVELVDEGQSEYPKVVCDYAAMGRCGAQHLLELGAVQFAFYCVFQYHLASKNIRDGFTSEINANGFPVTQFGLDLPHNPVGRTKSSRADRVNWLIQKLAGTSLPIAVMAEDDRFAVDLLLAVRALNLRVPEDVAILGADDQRLVLGSLPIEMSSVDGNLHEVGRRGAELLNRLVHGAIPGSPGLPMITCVPPKGVAVRHSTATFACDHPGVTSAALFVRRHFREPITVKDVASQSGMSVRMLQMVYPSYVGRAVKEDILKHRIVAAQSLLERTDLKLDAIAIETGFTRAEYLCRIFQQKHGMTPNDWRCQHGRQPASGGAIQKIRDGSGLNAQS